MARRPLIAACAVTALVMAVSAARPAGAGGRVGLHFGSDHFGMSLGFGDWGLYGAAWNDPGWALDFDATLAGYGQWVWINGLGRCWRPWVEVSWRPYTHGRWVHTGLGWTWVAYEPWGYVPHHYGSWAYCSYGWVWVPGYSYVPANVVWVRAGGYVGWYARPPHGWSHAAHAFRHGYREGFREGYREGYGDGYVDGWRDARYGTWVDWRHFGSDNVAHHAVAHGVASRSRVDAGIAAPTSSEVTRRGAVVHEVRLETRTVRAAGREVMVARVAGIQSSIERHAPSTVRSALADEAIRNRQPAARTQSVDRTRSRPDDSSSLSAPSRAVEAPLTRRPVDRAERASPLRPTGTVAANRPPQAGAAPSSTSSRSGITRRPIDARADASTSRSRASAPPARTAPSRPTVERRTATVERPGVEVNQPSTGRSRADESVPTVRSRRSSAPDGQDRATRRRPVEKKD